MSYEDRPAVRVSRASMGLYNNLASLGQLVEEDLFDSLTIIALEEYAESFQEYLETLRDVKTHIGMTLERKLRDL